MQEFFNQLGIGTNPNDIMEKPSKVILADNLNDLMWITPSLKGNVKLAAASGLGLGTMSRVRNAECAVNLDTLDTLAAAFKVPAWELLVDKAPQPQKDSLDALLDRYIKDADRAAVRAQVQELIMATHRKQQLMDVDL